MTQDIVTSIDAGVLTIGFNRLDRKNAISGAMYAAMAQALGAADGDPQVHAAVVQGHPSVFTAGNDLGDFLGAKPGEESSAFSFIDSIATFSKPLLAAVCGPAVGIGTTMLLHCDMVYAGDNAKFSMPFVNLGLCTEAASSLLVPKMFGMHRAAELLLLGEPFGAETARELGLVNKVLPPEEVNGFAQAQACKFAAKPMSSVIEIKRLMRLSNGEKVKERIAVEGALFRTMLGQPAAREAMTAFTQKRKPDFSKA